MDAHVSLLGLSTLGKASRVKRLAHEPGRFVVEINPGANERQN
jgi:hypothetical protein